MYLILTILYCIHELVSINKRRFFISITIEKRTAPRVLILEFLVPFLELTYLLNDSNNLQVLPLM